MQRSYIRRYAMHALLIAALLILMAISSAILVLTVRTYRLTSLLPTVHAVTYSSGASLQGISQEKAVLIVTHLQNSWSRVD